MATTYKILGQVLSSGAIGTEAVVYTVPSTKASAVISTLSICNTGATAATFNIAIRQGGAALSAKQYFAYGVTVPAASTINYTNGITLAQGDIVGIYSSSALLAAQAFGSEIV